MTRRNNIVHSYFTSISILVFQQQESMRLTVLALFIALPAAAYGAVCPQLGLEYSSLEFKGNCAALGESCADRGCCDSLKCTYISLLGMVCLMIPISILIHLGLLSFYVEMHT